MHLGEISDRSPVGVVEDILKVVIGLLLGGTADDAHGRPHLDVATALTRQSLGLGDAPGTGLWCFDRVEMHIRVADGEPASGLGAAGVHHQRVCVIEGPWRTFHAVELVIRPLVIEPAFAGPDPLDDAPPLFALSVAGVVLLLGHPEHLELVLVPATDDVHAEASPANVVPRSHLLGRHEGMMQGNVDRAEHVQAPRRGQQATRPGNRFEAGPVGVGLASVALPPRDGHHALDPDLVRHLREPEVVLPARLPALGERGIRSPARAIGAEEPEPEAIAVLENRIALSHPRFLLPAAPLYPIPSGQRDSRRFVDLPCSTQLARLCSKLTNTRGPPEYGQCRPSTEPLLLISHRLGIIRARFRTSRRRSRPDRRAQARAILRPERSLLHVRHHREYHVGDPAESDHMENRRCWLFGATRRRTLRCNGPGLALLALAAELARSGLHQAIEGGDRGSVRTVWTHFTASQLRRRHMNDHQGLSRRHVLGMAIAAGGFALASPARSVFAQALNRTPGEILGPFYPVLRSVEKTADLTTVPGKPGRAAGQVIYVPIPCWSACSAAWRTSCRGCHSAVRLLGHDI